MAEAPEGREIRYPAYIAHVAADAKWAKRLSSDLAAAGISGVMASQPLAHEDLPERQFPAELSEAGALIVLITPASYQSGALHYEVGRFEAMAQAGGRGDPLVVPIVFGADLVEGLIDRIRMRQYLLVDQSVYRSRNFDAPEWERAVRGVRQALARPDEEQPQPSAVFSREPPEAVLGRARVSVLDHSHAGWLLGDDLAIAPVGSGLVGRELHVSADVGVTQGVVSAWARPVAAGLRDMALLRLNPAFELPRPLPIASPETGGSVEFWSTTLRRTGIGLIGDEHPDGGFELTLLEGKVGPGPGVWAVWDPVMGRYLGVAIRTADGEWLMFSLMGLREVAGKPARSAAVRPLSARIHDDSWTIEDRLDYALYGRAIKEFVQHPDTKPPLVIGVQGPWGQGKTSLMRIAQDQLDGQHADLVARRNATSAVVEAASEITLKDLRDSLDGDIEIESMGAGEVRSVWFNPWKYQSSEALWAGLAHAILTQLPTRLSRRAQELFWLKLQLHRIDAVAVRRDIHRLIFDRLLPWLVLSVLVAVVIGLACLIAGTSAAFGAAGALAGGTATAVVSSLVVSRRALSGKLEGSYLRYVRQPDYEGKMGYLHHVEEDVRAALKLLTPDGLPTVVFIDDLDRCGAAKISEVLEAINLFLSGDFPNCVFILGIDAQVVASAMETVHRQALGEDGGGKDDLKGNLGWRFLDKFIQLSFVMPRLSNRQREAYLASLVGTANRAEDENGAEQALDIAQRVRHDLATGRIETEQAAREVGALAEESTIQSAAVRQVAAEVISLGARDFSDADPEAIEPLRRRLDYLSDNPRTIKRAVNLYRFYRFIAWARQASAPDLDAADPDLIASWTVIAARWPQVVHWLQAEGRGSPELERRLRGTWEEDEPELCAFLSEETEFDLGEAMACGLW